MGWVGWVAHVIIETAPVPWFWGLGIWGLGDWGQGLSKIEGAVALQT